MSYATDSKSWKENINYDIVSAETMDALKPAYVDDKHRDEISEPIRADTSWWKNIPAKSILNVYGGAEVFRDDIREIAKKLEEAGNPVQSVECPKEVHIENFIGISRPILEILRNMLTLWPLL